MRNSLYLIPILFLSCALIAQEEKFFYIENDKALMPVIIDGNNTSDITIVFIHGGPGNSGVLENELGNFDVLEEHYSVVYWDQRSSGLSLGNPESINNDLITNDLDLLIDVVKELYPKNKIILMGHSYGTTILCGYLSKPEYRSKIDGLISIDGTDNLHKNWEYSTTWYQNQTGNSNYVMDTRSSSKIKEHIDRVYEENGMYYNNSNTIEPTGELIFFSPLTLMFLRNEKECSEKLNNWWLSDYSEHSRDITIPSLVVSGYHDGIIPLESSRAFFDNLVNSTKKEFTVFNNSAHLPHLEEKREFSAAVISFIDKNI